VQINAYLILNGQCQAAFKSHERALNSEIVGMMTFGESPMSQQVTPEMRSKIIHIRMLVAIRKTVWSVRFGMLAD
jgi:PhnB protein